MSDVWHKKNDSLWYHGIKGQKWGIRRFQNPDGTLTALGKKRYEEHRNRLEEGFDRTPDGKVDYNGKNTCRLLSDNLDKEQSRVESILRNNGVDVGKLNADLAEVSFAQYDGKASRVATKEERKQFESANKAKDEAVSKYYKEHHSKFDTYQKEYKRAHPIADAFDGTKSVKYAREKVDGDTTLKQLEDEMKRSYKQVNDLYNTWRDRSLDNILNSIPKSIQDDVFVYMRDLVDASV